MTKTVLGVFQSRNGSITGMDRMVSSTQTPTHTFHKLHNEGVVSCLWT